MVWVKKMNYNYGTKRVSQALGTIYLGNLEGDFTQVIKHLSQEYEDYKKYIEESVQITETDYRGGAYLDGSSKKSVKFDRLYLDLVDSYDNKELRVMGERPMDADELAALDRIYKANEERERAELKRLKEKYPNV